MRAVDKLHGRAVLEQLEIDLSKQKGEDRAAFWARTLVQPSNHDLLRTLARCEGLTDRIETALSQTDSSSQREKALAAPVATIAKGISELCSFLSDGVHNPKGVEFVPVSKADPKRECQTLAICAKFKIDARSMDE